MSLSLAVLRLRLASKGRGLIAQEHKVGWGGSGGVGEGAAGRSGRQRKTGIQISWLFLADRTTSSYQVYLRQTRPWLFLADRTTLS